MLIPSGERKPHTDGILLLPLFYSSALSLHWSSWTLQGLSSPFGACQAGKNRLQLRGSRWARKDLDLNPSLTSCVALAVTYFLSVT